MQQSRLLQTPTNLSQVPKLNITWRMHNDLALAGKKPQHLLITC